MTSVVLVALWTLSRAGYESTVMVPADSCERVARAMLGGQDMRFPSAIMRARCADRAVAPLPIGHHREPSRVKIIKAAPIPGLAPRLQFTAER